ncbi:hypothetical protein K0M31_011206 [Melipona bicolor]|uniref:Neurotransmitter-gated ion-channel ligand-binding domain-containing protein n=1 Tax=Melipona bicolor TaxID=60889 RepID=A0AA40G931_9HYME|nr:hypothetical protein K0M31_011206 [Melipona bicolor]
MKNLFLALLVIFNVLLNKQATCVGIRCKDVVGNSALSRLKEYLFCDYYAANRMLAKNNATAVNVNFGLNLHQFEVDEIANTVEFSVWIKMIWTEPHFTWDKSKFDSITSLHVKSFEIWVPDIVMHSTTNRDVYVEMPIVDCVVNYKGTILCAPMTTYTTFCESDHTWWPYDVMNCTILVGSWSYASDEINLRRSFIDASDVFAENSIEKNLEWEVVNISESERVIKSKFGLDFTTDLLSYNILLKRHASMYTTMYVTLAIVLMTMTLMTLWLEPRSTERMVIANMNFILHLFCLLDLQWKLPFNGIHPPQLILFYEKSLSLAAFSLILTSILRYVQQLNTEAPTWISLTTVSILKSRVGQIFLLSILDPKVSARIEMNADDNTNLVSLDKKKSTWRFAKFF